MNTTQIHTWEQIIIMTDIEYLIDWSKPVLKKHAESEEIRKA